MGRRTWIIIFALLLSLVSTGSLFFGNRIPATALSLIIVGIIPVAIILGVILLNKNKKKGPAVAIIVIALFTVSAHLSIKIPFYIILSGTSFLFIMVRINKYKQQKINIVREVGVFLFFIYLLAVFNLTMSPFQFIAPYTHKFEMEWLPFKEIMEQFGRTPKLASYYAVGNIAMTIPFGLFMPLLFKRIRFVGTVIICGLCFSLTIELLQMLFTQRSAEVDDLIFNTLGAVIGFVLFKLIKKLFYTKN